MRVRNGILAVLGVLLFTSSHAKAAKFQTFPPNFKWCAATSAHQIEGGNTKADWWEWENLAPRCDASGCHCKVKNCEKSGLAADHWNRVDEDVRLMRDLNLKQYRFGIEWAKIEPREGEIDWNVVAHYRREVQQLEEAGIEPMITLQHFTLPTWVSQKGAWTWPGMPLAFKKFTELAYQHIGPRVRDWVTVNEPLIMLGGGYALGIMPPGLGPSEKPKREKLPKECRQDVDDSAPLVGAPTKQDILRVIPALEGLLKAHALAYHALHALAVEQNKTVRVGMANHLRIFEPRLSYSPFDDVVARIFDSFFNWSVPDALESGELKVVIPSMLSYQKKIPGLKRTQDFFGMNYYTRDLVWFKIKGGLGAGICAKNTTQANDMGWEIYPQGMYRLLVRVGSRYLRLPVLITENGLADKNDSRREKFLKDHLTEVHRAIGKGVKVEAYCHWSLMDNFEWIEGFGPRFGLYEIDYSTMARIPRPSARTYADIAAKNGFVQ